MGSATLMQTENRLSDVLLPASSRSFECLATLPSNIHAVESSLLFSAGLQTFTLIHGPSGWGKSHLLKIASERLEKERGWIAEPVCAVDYVNQRGVLEATGPLILDNVQDVLSRPKLRLQFRLLIERRVRAGRPTLVGMTTSKVGRWVRATLPSPRVWNIATINEPSTSEKELVVRQIVLKEGLAINDQIIRVISRRVMGNGRSLVGAVKRLRLDQGRWLGAEATLHACGVLEPFFGDPPAWDLRDHISETADAFWTSEDRIAMASYVMLQIAALPESTVAKYYKREQGEIYTLANRFQTRLRESQELSERVTKFVGTVVQGLDRA